MRVDIEVLLVLYYFFEDALEYRWLSTSFYFFLHTFFAPLVIC